MSTFCKPSQLSSCDEEAIFHANYKPKPPKVSYPSWYSPETGVYRSKYPPVPLPSDPFLDVVSFIFSHKHDGLTALVDSSSGFSLSYSKILPLIKSLASGLHQMGVSKGDVVLISVPNSIHFPIIFLGILAVGAIATAVNPLSSLSEIKKQVLDCKPSFGFCSPERLGELSALGFPVIGVPSTEFLMPKSQHCKDSDFHKLISSDPDLAPRPKINQQDAAAILYSSGTTGSCKGTVLSHENFIAAAVLFVRFEASTYAELPSTNVYLASVPMFHVYGLTLFVMGLLSLGTSIVVMRKFDADEMIRAIDKYSVTHFPTVPPILMKLTKMAKEGSSGSSFKSLKQVSCGAAPLTGKTIEDFVRTFPHVDFIQGYGMTETTAVGTRGYNTEKFHNYGSIGLLAPSVEAKVVNWTTGSLLPPGQTGELWLRSPGNMKGYLNNEDATKSTIDKDGWLRTGDIAFFDKDGYLYVVDRLKEIIKFKGFQIAPADLESILVSHPQIVDTAVTGYAGIDSMFGQHLHRSTTKHQIKMIISLGARDEEAGEIPVAFVVRKDKSGLSEAAVINFVAKQVAPYKKVRKVYFISSVPRSPAGKILRRELRTLLISKV